MESQTPPGPRPPQPPQPPSKETAWISPRLREKLGDSGPEDEGPKQASSPLIGIILAVLVIGGGAGLFASMRAGAAKEKVASEERARLAAAAATAESLASVAHADSVRQAMADSTGAGATAPGGATPAGGATASAPKPATPSRPTPGSGGATAGGTKAEPAAPREKGPFGLDVGTFIVEERAKSEQERLAAASGLPGRVVTRNEDGGDAYHVVLGSFATRAAAEKRAEALVAKGVVNQARAVALAP